VSERTTLEAMIMHSDNTATDMVLKHIGPDNVRAFLTSGQFANTLIPDSTLSFFGYLFGAPDYRTFTWDRLVASGGQPFVNPVLNTVTTLASSADDLVSLYSRALHGEFFEHDQTLNELRALLSFGDPIWVVPYPLGVSPFGKGGSIDISGTHILCVPGAMFFDDVWVYFAFILNWSDAAPTDPVTRDAFLKATATSLQLVKDALAAPLSSGPTGRLPATR